MEKLKITLYSTSDQVRSAIRTAFRSRTCDVLEITDSAKMPRVDLNEQQQPGTIGRLGLPDKVDAVVSTSALNSKTEGLAASLGLKQGRNDVYPVVLPEGLEWLRNKLDQYGELVLVGSDQAK